MERRYFVAALALIATFAVFSRGYERCSNILSCLVPASKCGLA